MQAERECWYRVQETMIFGAVLIFLTTLVGVVVTLSLFAGTNTCDSLPTYQGQVVNGSSGLPEPGYVAAFLADQGSGAGARAVLNLVRAEGADVVFHAGDLDYGRSPSTWERLVRNELWTDTYRPSYFFASGNHDLAVFTPSLGANYARAAARLHSEAAYTACEGIVGARAVCAYRGIALVQSAVGLTCDDNGGGFVQRSFARLGGWPWRVCLFHVNQRRMQLEDKGDAAEWAIYEECRKAGALIVTGHSHNYARTHLLSSMREGTVVHTNSSMRLEPGRSVATVVGLGGHSIRGARTHLRANPWWAVSLAAGDPDAGFGALFCRFATPRRAECYFKTTDGAVIDEFVLVT